MTVQELIEHLQQYPKDAVVGCVFRICSEYEPLQPEMITYHPDGRPPEVWRGTPIERFVLRNGRIMQYDPKTWPPDEVPHFVPVVAFPGN
jgi:hypothetical protein